MKIGIDARLAYETGVGRYIRNLIKELQVIDTDNEYVFFAKPKDVSELTKLKTKNSKIVATDIHWHSLSEQLRFARVLDKEQLDLVHFPYFSLPILYKKPFVVTIHDLIIHHFPTGKASTLPLPLYYGKRVAFQRVLKHGITKSKKIIVPLQAVKEDLVRTFNVSEDKIVVTYEGLDKNISKQSEGGGSKIIPKYKNLQSNNYFLYVGNAYPHKNVEGLIQGFAEFKKQTGDKASLVLVGKEDYFYRRLKNSLSQKLQQDCYFLHSVSDSELGYLYQHALSFISASKMEGFGLPPLEALGNSCLPLLSDIPSFKEVCQQSALYFDPNDPMDIARVLRKRRELPEKIKKEMLADGQKRVQAFSWKKMAGQTLEVYQTSLL